MNNVIPPDNASPILLKFEGLCKSFGGQSVLENAAATLRQGEVVLLRGANGSGKTTLLNILTGNLLPEYGSIDLFTAKVPVSFQFPQDWWKSLNPFDSFCPEMLARLEVSRTWQDTRLFPTETLQDNVAIATPNQLGEQPHWAVLRSKQVQLQEQRNLQAARRRLAQLGLQGRENSSADKISLGQAKRVMMARTLQTRARILLLDEPLAGLDHAGMKELVSIFKRLVKEENLTLIVVEHLFNIPQILELATTVWTLRERTVQVEAPKVVREEMAQAEGGLEGWFNHLQEEGQSLLRTALPGNAVLSILRAPSSSVEQGATVLEVENLMVSQGRRAVLGAGDGLSFCLRQGDLAVLQAPNGWGKTTLLEAIAGLIPIGAGMLYLKGHPINGQSPWKRAKRGIAFLQSRNNLFPGLTVMEAFHLSHVSQVPEEVRGLLNQPMTALSGGERQRVLLACLDKSAALSLYDEPFLALDSSGLAAAWQELQPKPGQACLVVVPSMVKEVE